MCFCFSLWYLLKLKLIRWLFRVARILLLWQPSWSDQRDNILAMPNVDLMYSFVIFFRHLETVFCMKGWTSWFLATVPTFDCIIFAGVCFCSSYTVHRYMPLHTSSGTQETRDHPHVEIITELSGCCKLYQFTVNSTYVSSLLAPFTPIQCHQEEEKLRQFLPLPKSIFLYLWLEIGALKTAMKIEVAVEDEPPLKNFRCCSTYNS